MIQKSGYITTCDGAENPGKWWDIYIYLRYQLVSWISSINSITKDPFETKPRRQPNSGPLNPNKCSPRDAVAFEEVFHSDLATWKNSSRSNSPTKIKAISAGFSVLHHIFFKVGSAELVIVLRFHTLSQSCTSCRLVVVCSKECNPPSKIAPKPKQNLCHWFSKLKLGGNFYQEPCGRWYVNMFANV